MKMVTTTFLVINSQIFSRKQLKVLLSFPSEKPSSAAADEDTRRSLTKDGIWDLTGQRRQSAITLELPKK